VRGAVDARLSGADPLRRGLPFGLPGALALAVDVVYTNVIRPGGDDSSPVWFGMIFALQFAAGLVAAPHPAAVRSRADRRHNRCGDRRSRHRHVRRR
jgi:hypothetical protein